MCCACGGGGEVIASPPPPPPSPGAPVVPCDDTDNGAVDPYNDGCAEYNSFPSWCGGYDDEDFISEQVSHDNKDLITHLPPFSFL